MKLLNFGTYYCMHSGYLQYNRVSKYVVEVKRMRGDLPIIKYFLADLYGRISRYFGRLSSVIDYEIRVTEGLESNVVWKSGNGMYIPVDTLFNEELPRLARKNVPTKKVIKKGYIIDTGKPCKIIASEMFTDAPASPAEEAHRAAHRNEPLA